MMDLHGQLEAIARSYDKYVKPGLAWDQTDPLHTTGAGNRPGDDFNRRASWAEVLEPFGWTLARTQGDVQHWKRPGNTESRWSATANHHKCPDGTPALHVFSTSAAPFANDKSYSLFGAYTLLNHAGDYKAAARALAGKGYGEQRQRTGPMPSSNGTGHANGNGQAKTPEPWDPPIPLNEVPEPMPFPVEVFPRCLQDFVREVAWSVNCPPDFAAVPMLSIAGAAIGNSRRIAITKTHTQSACLFTIVVGNPGSGKSPALEQAVEPLEKAEILALRRWNRELDEWNQAGEGKGPKPILQRILLDDVTTEKMVCLLSENPRGLCMVRDELAALVAGMDQYKGGKGHDRQIYLKLFSGASIRVDRKNQLEGQPLVVYRPFVPITGGIQPTVIERLRGESQGSNQPPDDGFVDRFLFSYPVDLPAIEEGWRDVSDEAADCWRQTVYALLALDMFPHEDGKRPYYQTLSLAGREAWVRFTRAHAAEINAESFPAFLRGAWSKLIAYCARLALIVFNLRTVCGETLGSQVDGESIDRAAKLVAYFKSHACRVYASMEIDAEVADANLVLRWIGREGRTEFKAWEAHKDLNSKTRFPRVEDLERILARLCKNGYLRTREPEQPPGPGRKQAFCYEVNPNYKGPGESGKSGK